MIRISRGERDASARATHLEAVTRKFLVTTNERKQMSTKTNFKRIALVAVAALGMGVLSSVPSQATFTTVPTVAVTTGTSTKAKSDSTTAATITVAFNTDSAADSIVLTATPQSYPGSSVPALVVIAGGDTTGSTVNVKRPFGTLVSSATSGTTTHFSTGAYDAAGATTPGAETVSMTAANGVVINAPAAGRISYKLLAQIDSVATAREAGTYTWLIAATTYTSGTKQTTTPVSATLTITVAALDSESKVASAGTSVGYINTSAATATTDVVPSVLATASTTPRAYIYVDLKNASGAAASESITITTTVGSIGTSSTAGSIGKNVTLAYTGGANYYGIFADGTAGTAVITVKSASVTFANKTVVFYAAAPTTITLTPLNTTPGVGTTTAFTAKAVDANGAIWGGSLAVYSDTLATISDTGTACTSLVATKGYHVCTVTGLVAGTAKVNVRDASLAIKSADLSLTVSTSSAATVKLSWDKASYAPGEKAYLFVDVLGSDGKNVPSATYANLFASGGITLTAAAGNGSDTLTSTVVYTNNTMASLGLGTGTDPRAVYTVYMPSSGATVKASATGGTSLPLAGQVAVSASATVTDSGAAALAAVNALATTVASLRTLITTLTNLVLKIQKKVKA